MKVFLISPINQWFSVHFLISFLFQSTLSSKDVSFGHDTALDNSMCAFNDITFIFHNEDIIKCVTSCTQSSTCNSVFHKKSSEGCFGCSNDYLNSEGLPAEPGTKYYKKTCGIVPQISNGYFDPPSSKFIGVTVVYHCNAGYGFGGSNTATCLGTGLWSETPTCLIDCGLPPVLNRGEVKVLQSSTHTLEGDTKKYTCSYSASNCTYYVLYGSSTSTCQADGSWSSIGSCQTMTETGYLPDGVTPLTSDGIKGCQSTFDSTDCNSGTVAGGLLFTGLNGGCYCDVVCCDYMDCCYDFNCYPSKKQDAY